MTLTPATVPRLAFAKTPDALLPAVVQHARDGRVLMLGYVSAESLAVTFDKGLVTFFSRSKQRLWTKGEESGHTLALVSAHADCDRDAVLFRVLPKGPTCHTGEDTCFDEGTEVLAPYAPSGKTDSAADDDAATTTDDLAFLLELEDLLHGRQPDADSKSYTSRLLAKGVMKVAQKVGEEGVEMALEATGGTDDLLTEEAADLMYHYLLLLRAKGQRLGDVVRVLRGRHA